MPARPPLAASGFAGLDRRNYDESLRQRPIIGDGKVDPRLVARRRQGFKPGERPARQLHGRTPARQVHHPHVAPPDAAPDSGSQRLGAGFLGGESLGVGRHHHSLVLGAAPGPGALGIGENAIETPLAVPLDHRGNPGDIDQVGADADDHGFAVPLPAPAITPSIAWRPRSISARMRRTVSPSPPNSASPLM